ncbi:MAG TPA: lysophospholipid acyltransferase family protein [Burkholderiales bacterium]|nr:lysophospholipid acyltransferase family protein [Burkholderiales bacterium]
MRAESLDTRLPAALASPPAAFRLLAVVAWLACGLAVAALIFPLASRSLRLSLRRFWAQTMLHALGVELHVEGTAIAPGALLVANHVSWLDILALASRTPAVFVAKSEVRRWPMIGWLAARAETVFIRRASGRSLLEVKNRIAGFLLDGRSVAMFPEATTSDGETVLPFRSGLLQAAVDADRALQAVAIAYRDERGRRSSSAAFIDGVSLCRSIVTVCSAGHIRACVAIAAPLAPAGRCRKLLARQARGAVAAMLGARN